jgi:hypothetical protein
MVLAIFIPVFMFSTMVICTLGSERCWSGSSVAFPKIVVLVLMSILFDYFTVCVMYVVLALRLKIMEYPSLVCGLAFMLSVKRMNCSFPHRQTADWSAKSKPRLIQCPLKGNKKNLAPQLLHSLLFSSYEFQWHMLICNKTNCWVYLAFQQINCTITIILYTYTTK